MEYVFTILVAILAALVIMIFELRKLSAQLKNRYDQAAKPMENREGSPTINVNLGTMPFADDRPKRLKKSDAIDQAADELPESALPSPEPEPPPPPKFSHIQPRTTSGGLAIVKCPACEAENSGFRTECFNCGARL